MFAIKTRRTTDDIDLAIKEGLIMTNQLKLVYDACRHLWPVF